MLSAHRWVGLRGFSGLFPDSNKGNKPNCYERPIGSIGPIWTCPVWCFVLALSVSCRSAALLQLRTGAGASLLALRYFAGPSGLVSGRVSCEKQKCENNASLHGGTKLMDFKLRHYSTSPSRNALLARDAAKLRLYRFRSEMIVHVPPVLGGSQAGETLGLNRAIHGPLPNCLSSSPNASRRQRDKQKYSPWRGRRVRRASVNA